MSSTMIRLNPFIVDANGHEEIFGDETGTTEFYMVKQTLTKYLGKHVYISWNYDNFMFEIENDDESCDNTDDYIDIIETINESLSHFNTTEYLQKCHLSFEIISVE